MSTPGLTAVAAAVLRSLVEHPELRMPDAIAEELEEDTDTVGDALIELEDHGLAQRDDDDGGWRATDDD
jgi:DNA-binding IclR family transcriptional regulator